METTAQFSINETGTKSGRLFSGSFTVKTLLTRADQFAADQKRREILGPGGQEALEGLRLEAFMLGQLSVRIVKAPQFWEDTNQGLNLEDFNIIQILFDKCIELEGQRSAALQQEAKQALERMAGKERAKQESGG